MTAAYTPGLRVAERVRHTVRRMLPVPGTVTVQPGDRVRAEATVATALLPGEVMPINLAQLLGATPAEVPALLLHRIGEEIRQGEPLAVSKGMFGWFRREMAAPVSGILESVSKITGQMIVRGPALPLPLRAYLSGTVQEVQPGYGCTIVGETTCIQGIFGIGGEAFGTLRPACDAPGQTVTANLITPALRNCVVLGGARITADALRRGVELGIAAIVTGGIDDQDLRAFLGYDLGVAVTGTERAGLTLILTEGFGDIAMAERTFRLLQIRAGAPAAVNGATQIRAGVQRPEILIPWETPALQAERSPTPTAGALAVGMPVRLVRDPYFGLLGTVTDLPPEPQVLESGSVARVLKVRLESGEVALVPRANVELIEA